MSGAIRTPRAAIRRITKPEGALERATVVAIDVLGRDQSGAATSVSPSVVVNLHSGGGYQRVELGAGIDPLTVNLGDELFITRVRDRYVGVQPLPLSNRTLGGAASYGKGVSQLGLGEVQALDAHIAGQALHLTWAPVARAAHYELWQAETADPTTVADGGTATVIGITSNNTWVSQRTGELFDDGLYYAVRAIASNGQGGPLSDWVQPSWSGSQAYGLVSKNQNTAVGGSFLVARAASVLRADFTAYNTNYYYSPPLTLDVCDPLGTHPVAAPFGIGNILQVIATDNTPVWLEVMTATDYDTYWRYEVYKRDPAGSEPFVPSGTPIVDWGQPGQGVFIVSADGSWGAGTLWQIITHQGEPWNTYTVQVYADSTGKVLAGAGTVTLNADGIAVEPGSTFENARSYGFASGGIRFSDLYVLNNVTTVLTHLDVLRYLGKNSSAVIDVTADTGKEAIVELNADVYGVGPNATVILDNDNGVTSVELIGATVKATGNFRVTGNLGVGNSAAGSSLGTVTKKIQVYDAAGNSLGYLPVYDAIT